MASPSKPPPPSSLDGSAPPYAEHSADRHGATPDCARLIAAEILDALLRLENRRVARILQNAALAKR